MRNLTEGRYYYDVLVTGDTESEDILDTSISVRYSFFLNKTTLRLVIPYLLEQNLLVSGHLLMEILPGTAVTFVQCQQFLRKYLRL